MAEYKTVSMAAEEWGITSRRIYDMLKAGRVPGAVRIGAIWMIPADLEKPADGRIKSGDYIGFRSKLKTHRSDNVPDETESKE